MLYTNPLMAGERLLKNAWHIDAVAEGGFY